MKVVEKVSLCHRDGREVCVMATGHIIGSGDDRCLLLSFAPLGATAIPWDRRTKVDRRAASAVRQKLSERERLVLTLIATGHTNKSIAQCLNISVKTVESHRLRIMQKLDVHKATDLVRLALTSDLLSKDSGTPPAQPPRQ
jgi:DNA-binding NarL/FixJ family response regulator